MIKYVVEIKVNDKWVPAQRIRSEHYDSEEAAIIAAKVEYPITCALQSKKGGPIGIRVMDVVLQD